MTDKTYYTTRETGDLLGQHRNTILTYILKGEFPAVKVGREYRIPKKFIDDKMAAIAKILETDD